MTSTKLSFPRSLGLAPWRAAILAAAILAAISPQARADAVAARVQDASATLENGLIRATFDAAKGSYRVEDVATGETLLADASFDAAGISSRGEGRKFHIADEAVADALGRGRALVVRRTLAGQPDAILRIAVYEGRTCLTLGCSVVNTTGGEIRLKEFCPLTNARLFPNAKFTQAKTLDGLAGAGALAVAKGPYRHSLNNLLLTFLDGGKRRSVVLGGLTYHDFIKEAILSSTSLRSPRRGELTAVAQAAGGKLAAYIDSGAEREDISGGVRLKQVRGTPYVFGGGPGDSAMLSIAFDNQEVIYEAQGLDPAKSYTLGFSWWDCDNNGRVESVYVVGADGVRRPLVENRRLPAWADRQQPAEQLSRTIPPEAYRSGKLQIVFAKIAAKEGSNAVVSETWLWEGGKDYPAAAKAAKETTADPALVLAHLRAFDPSGRRIAAGETWLADDRCYIDLSATDPFAALEQYGLAVRAAQKAKPNIYDFPTLCAWYVQDFTGGPKINNTAALVEEMDCIVKSGFLKYSPVALRLVPDTYTPDSEQGWWDDAHWRKLGHYTSPCETSAKWCEAIRRRGGLPFTYFQTGFVSHDYAKAFPGHFLNRHPVPIPKLNVNTSFDYTAADFQRHMREVWGNLGRAGMAGVMFDYPESGWRIEGGFEDPKADTTSAYREIFALCREGLGPKGYIHERNVDGWQPFVDATAGLVDSQRVWGDNSEFDPVMARICGLRWYKNRVLFTYDMDAKSLLLRRSAKAPDAAVRRQSILTMLYVTAGRVLLADSFRECSPEILRELSRIFPIHSEPRSARPLDFLIAPNPRVYDFAVDADWHQLTLFNPDFKNPATIDVPLAGRQDAGALGLNADQDYWVYDFWHDRLAGKLHGGDQLQQRLAAGEARMLAVHRVETQPQFLSTNRHIMQGYVDLVKRPAWDATVGNLEGVSRAAAGEPYKIVLAGNGFRAVSASAVGAKATIEAGADGDGLVRLTLVAPEGGEVRWSVHFAR